MVKFPHVLACVGECSGPTFFHFQHIFEVFLHDHNEAKVRDAYHALVLSALNLLL